LNLIRITIESQGKSLANKTAIVISGIAATALGRQIEMIEEERGAGLRTDTTETGTATVTVTVIVIVIAVSLKGIEMDEALETEIEAPVGIESIIGEDIRQNQVDTSDHVPPCTMEPGLVPGHLRPEV